MIKFEIKKNTPLKPFNRHWQFCVGSGHAALALRTDYCRQLKRVRDELGIERVRFHGIFCDDMHTLHSLRDVLPVPGARRFTEQSFRLCGLAYDNVMDCGMQPFVELSFMPKMLAARNKKGLFFYKPNISMPKSLGAWESYIEDFIRFLLRRYGKSEVEGWFFEVWNEPDLPRAFFGGTQSDYYRLYESTARAIKRVNPALRTGGPSTSGSRWVEDFVRHCKARDIPLDFVSTHQYAGDPLGGIDEQKSSESSIGPGEILRILGALRGVPDGSVLDGMRKVMADKSETEDVPDYLFAQNAPLVKAQAGGLPVYYTEWNENATFSAYTNDTRKSAAYIVKAILSVEESVSGSSVWCFSDIFEELHPFPEEFHGGFGLLSQHGIPKPAYHALKLLAQAGGERYILPDGLSGEISLAAFKGEGTVDLVLTRQRMKNLSLPKLTATVEIELDGPPESVTLHRIDEDSGNPLKIWEAMGRPLDMTPGEVKEIERESGVKPEKLPSHFENGSLSITCDLGVNDLCFARIELPR